MKSTDIRSEIMDFLQYFYVFLWAILAVLLFFTGRKQGAVAYVMSLFFVYMTVWYGLEAFGGFKMFEGIMSLVFRIVLIAFLILFVAVYFLLKKKDNNSDNDSQKK